MNDEVRPPLTTTTSILPAAAVLVVAVVTLAIFLLINFVASPHVKGTSTTLPVFVGGLAARSGHALAGCQQPDNPPGNIATALIVPVRTVATGPAHLPTAGAGDFDCVQGFTTTASSAQVLGFYDAQLVARGWALFSRGSNSGQPQLLFQKAGSDTFYWVVGITVTNDSGHRADWTYQIYQNTSGI